MADSAAVSTIVARANAAGLPPELLLWIGAQESGLNPSSVNSIGATGIWQMTPGKPVDPRNVAAATDYMINYGGSGTHGFKQAFQSIVGGLGNWYNASPDQQLRWAAAIHQAVELPCLPDEKPAWGNGLPCINAIYEQYRTVSVVPQWDFFQQYALKGQAINAAALPSGNQVSESTEGMGSNVPVIGGLIDSAGMAEKIGKALFDWHTYVRILLFIVAIFLVWQAMHILFNVDSPTQVIGKGKDAAA